MNIRRPISEVYSELTEIVNNVALGQDRYVLTQNGKELAAVISMDDLKLLEELEDKLDVKAAKRADKEIRKHGTIKWKDAKGE